MNVNEALVRVLGDTSAMIDKNWKPFLYLMEEFYPRPPVI